MPARETCFFIGKLDSEKAYDGLWWDFIEQHFKQHGYSPEWIGWIMTLVINVLYVITLSGDSVPILIHNRLRQSDPLYPYNFIFYANALSTVINQEVWYGTLWFYFP